MLRLFERALGSIVHKVIPGQTDLESNSVCMVTNELASVSSHSYHANEGNQCLSKLHLAQCPCLTHRFDPSLTVTTYVRS